MVKYIFRFKLYMRDWERERRLEEEFVNFGNIRATGAQFETESAAL